MSLGWFLIFLSLFRYSLSQCLIPGKNVVNRIITELAVFDVDPNGKGLILREIAEGVTHEEVKKKTEASYTVAPDCCTMKSA